MHSIAQHRLAVTVAFTYPLYCRLRLLYHSRTNSCSLKCCASSLSVGVWVSVLGPGVVPSVVLCSFLQVYVADAKRLVKGLKKSTVVVKVGWTPRAMRPHLLTWCCGTLECPWVICNT